MRRGAALYLSKETHVPELSGTPPPSRITIHPSGSHS